MKTLVILVSLALVFVAALVGAALYQEHQFDQSPEGVARATLARSENTERDDIQSRVDTLAVDGCSKPALTVLAQHKAKPITARSDVPAALLEDLDLCVQRGIMYGYVRDQLDDVGILVKL